MFEGSDGVLLVLLISNRIADSNCINAVSFSAVRPFLRGSYEIKLTANSCIALCGSTNAVSISSTHTAKRFP